MAGSGGGASGGLGLKIGILIGAVVLLIGLIVAAVLLWPASRSFDAVTGANNAAPAPPQPASDPTRDADREAARRDRQARQDAEEAPPEEEEFDPPPVAPAAPGYDGDTSAARLVSGSISDADYPAAAQRLGEEGTVTISYVVGTDGRVSSCAVTGSSRSATLDSTSCNIVTRRFRFEPARRYGRPVPETRAQRIVWRLPQD